MEPVIAAKGVDPGRKPDFADLTAGEDGQPAKFFGTIAQDYDQPLHAAFYHRIGSKLVGMIPRTADRLRQVLEIGAGTGFATELLCQRLPGARVTALEPAGEMRDRGRQRAPSANWSDVPLLSISPDGYDLIVSSMAFHWFSARERAHVDRLASSGLLALALPVTGGPSGEGNQVLKTAARALGVTGGWQRQVRRPGAVEKTLSARFRYVTARSLIIREEYADSHHLAESLYTRGALQALFGRQAPLAFNMILGQKKASIEFSWKIRLLVATAFKVAADS